VLFDTLGMTIMTLAVAAGLLVRGHRRAAIFTVGVMVATTLTYTVIKLLVGRARPARGRAPLLEVVPVRACRGDHRLRGDPDRARGDADPPQRRTSAPLRTEYVGSSTH